MFKKIIRKIDHLLEPYYYDHRPLQRWIKNFSGRFCHGAEWAIDYTREDLEDFLDKFTGKGRAKQEILQSKLPDLFYETIIMIILWGDKYPVLFKYLSDFGEYLNRILMKHNPRNLKKEELIYWIVRTPIDDDKQLISKANYIIEYLGNHYHYNLGKPKKYSEEKLVRNFNGFIDEYFAHFCKHKSYSCICCDLKNWHDKYLK